MSNSIEQRLRNLATLCEQQCEGHDLRDLHHVTCGLMAEIALIARDAASELEQHRADARRWQTFIRDPAPWFKEWECWSSVDDITEMIDAVIAKQ